MKIDAKKFLALTQLMAMPLVTASSGCIINTDDESSTGNDSANDVTTDASNTTTATASTTGNVEGSGSEGATGGTADASAGTGEGGTVEETGATGGTAAEAGTAGSDTGGDAMGCCTVHPEPGCSDPAIEACVCAMDALCCDAVEGTWDQICIDEVAQFMCGRCP